MSTVKRRLPSHPHSDVPKQEARELFQQVKAGQQDALDRVRRQHPKFTSGLDNLIKSTLKLSDAQLVIAREYGLSSWPQLKKRIDINAVTHLIDDAIRSSDVKAITQLFSEHQHLLDVPVTSGNWGPPMSHAANLGKLEVVKSIASLGAKDFQHAFERALLQGQLETARWLKDHGARLLPGIIMGSCETLNAAGFGFLDDQNAPLEDAMSNRLAPLAMVLETYSRNPAGKHRILQRFRDRGYEWNNDAIMAFHTGNLSRLEEIFKDDPGLPDRRFGYRKIFPTKLGCANDYRSGLHGTPIDGTTLLHLSIDYDEREIFDWLLTSGADVNAPAQVDNEGFGGHTPLFNAMVSCAYSNGRQRDGYMVRRLLEGGADPEVRVNLRKFLDWQEQPGWHIAMNVTPVEWADSFPERNWVNAEGLEIIRQRK